MYRTYEMEKPPNNQAMKNNKLNHSYNQEIIIPKEIKDVERIHNTSLEHKEHSEHKDNSILNIFSNLQADDIILIAILIFLLWEKNDDKLALFAVAFVFLSGL